MTAALCVAIGAFLLLCSQGATERSSSSRLDVLAGWGMSRDIEWAPGAREDLAKRIEQEVKIADSWLVSSSEAIEKAPSDSRSSSHLAKGYLSEICRAKLRALNSDRTRLWPRATPPPFCAMWNPSTDEVYSFGLASTTVGGSCYVFRIDQAQEPIAFNAMLSMYQALVAEDCDAKSR